MNVPLKRNSEGSARMRRFLALAVPFITMCVYTSAVSAGADTRTCFGKPATIVGTDQRDVLNGTAGDDVIVTLAGNDTVTLYGGGTDYVCAGGGDDIVGWGDRAGRRGDKFISGGPGNDILQGGNAHDIINGGSGDDRLEGGGGNDVLNGGGDVDTAYYDDPGATAGVVVDLAAGTATGTDIGNDRLQNIENAKGTDFGDQLFGDGGDNVLNGEGGIDSGDGRDGFDTCIAIEKQVNCEA